MKTLSASNDSAGTCSDTPLSACDARITARGNGRSRSTSDAWALSEKNRRR